MPISGDDDLGTAGERRFEHAIIRWVRFDFADLFGRLGNLTDACDLPDGFFRRFARPPELRRQDPSELAEKRGRGYQLDPPLEGEPIHQLRGTSGEEEGGDQDVRIEDDPHPRRASWISRSTSRSSTMPRRGA